jgi:putative GTP pyrophosphokinase
VNDPKNFRSGEADPNERKNFDDESFWLENPEMIRRFIGQRPVYEKLCGEVAYILERALNAARVEFSTITSRAKTLGSFLGKIQRKTYRDPIAEITDLAGVRVVCLYVDDLARLEQTIAEHFEIVEKVDKLAGRPDDQFGYGAIHFVVKLGEGSSGARYDDLKNLVCEIQIRTVLQDAWAIIDHHLVYKNESNIPSVLRSKLNRLAGNFAAADEEFRRIRAERRQYLTAIEESKATAAQFLDNELNLDSFVRYAQWKFPHLPSGTAVVDAAFFLQPLIDANLRKLSELDGPVGEGKLVLDRFSDAHGRDFLSSNAITSVVAALFFVDPRLTPAKHIGQLFPKYAEFARREAAGHGPDV